MNLFPFVLLQTFGNNRRSDQQKTGHGKVRYPGQHGGVGKISGNEHYRNSTAHVHRSQGIYASSCDSNYRRTKSLSVYTCQDSRVKGASMGYVTTAYSMESIICICSGFWSTRSTSLTLSKGPYSGILRSSLDISHFEQEVLLTVLRDLNSYPALT